MADTRFPSFLRVAGSSSPPAANPQVEHMIGVSDPYRLRASLLFSHCSSGWSCLRQPRARTDRSKARHEAGAKEGQIRAAAAGGIIAAPKEQFGLLGSACS
jgi:hypothetical protein